MIATGAVWAWERRQPDTDLKGIFTVFAIAVGLPVSIRVGHVLDRAINRPVYQSLRREPLVEINPVVGPGIGIGVRVHIVTACLINVIRDPAFR